MTELERIISELVKTAELQSENRIGDGYHGSSKGETIPYTVWYEPYYRKWTTKEIAMRGYLISKLMPIINKCIKENE